MKECPVCGRENLDVANFCDGCGQRLRSPKPPSSINTKASRAFLETSLPERRYELFPDKDALVGRGAPGGDVVPDIMFPERDAIEHGVSRIHAKIFCHGNTYYIADLDSTNSVYLNGKKLAPQFPYELKHGDRLEFGLYKAGFLLDEP